MDARILAEMQARVQDDDDFWILGDFAIAKGVGNERARILELFDYIPGRKHLILGNHDIKWVQELGWHSVEHFHELKTDSKRISLSHYPMITFPGARHGAVQLFGHVHQNWPGSRNSVNVGVDLWDFRPVSLAEIEARAATLPVNRHWDEVEPGCSFPAVSCEGCSRILDPALVSGHAILRDGRIVIAETGELIVTVEPCLQQWLREGHHVCPECIGGYLSIGEATLPVGLMFDKTLNRAFPKEE